MRPMGPMSASVRGGANHPMFNAHPSVAGTTSPRSYRLVKCRERYYKANDFLGAVPNNQLGGVPNSATTNRMAFNNANNSSQQPQLQQTLTPLPRPSPNNICTTAPIPTTHTSFSISNSGSTSQFLNSNQQQVSDANITLSTRVLCFCKNCNRFAIILRFYFSFNNSNKLG